MIKSFSEKQTENFWNGNTVRKFINFENTAVRKLSMINAATELKDLRSPPNNSLEKLSGDQAGQYSIGINQRWRVCFRFENGNAYDVEIVDYH